MPMSRACLPAPARRSASQGAVSPAKLSRRTTLQAVAACALGSLALGVTPVGLHIAQAADAPLTTPVLLAELATDLPGAQALGSATLRFLGLQVYEARLWVPSGFNPSAYAQSPFGLELIYFRSLRGRLIAERSLKEMQRQGKLSPQREQAWLQAMEQTFPDVNAGDRITGLHTPGVGARFWFNGRSLPAVRDADFSRLFFGIWLSEASSEPQMRKALLGLPA